jgi:hypothetical protein
MNKRGGRHLWNSEIVMRKLSIFKGEAASIPASAASTASGTKDAEWPMGRPRRVSLPAREQVSIDLPEILPKK